MSLPPITLRYFNCHGRAQYLRYYLLARDIAFVDERIELDGNWASWAAIKDDTLRTGPFHKLPMLEWGTQTFSESPVIHDWLHQQSGDADLLSAEDNLRHAMLTSSCSSELMMPVGMLLWVEATHPGVSLQEQLEATLPKVKSHLALLEETLIKWNWWADLSSRKIMLADCLLWQQLWAICHIFGSAVELEIMPALHKFYQHCPEREIFDQLIKDHPLQLTGHSEEQDVIKRIQGYL